MMRTGARQTRGVTYWDQHGRDGDGAQTKPGCDGSRRCVLGKLHYASSECRGNARPFLIKRLVEDVKGVTGVTVTVTGHRMADQVTAMLNEKDDDS